MVEIWNYSTRLFTFSASHFCYRNENALTISSSMSLWNFESQGWMRALLGNFWHWTRPFLWVKRGFSFFHFMTSSPMEWSTFKNFLNLARHSLLLSRAADEIVKNHHALACTVIPPSKSWEMLKSFIAISNLKIAALHCTALVRKREPKTFSRCGWGGG